MTWRAHAAPIIASVIRQHGYSDLKALRKALRDAYPFGQREMHPYKIWCDEVRRQTNGRLSRRGPKPTFRTRGDVAKACDAAADLFAGGAE
jgi:hypothetical protein